MKNRRMIPLFLAVLSLLSLSWRCAGPVRDNQLLLGIWAAENNLWEEALFRWKKEVAARPGSAAAHNNLAVALEKKGLWAEARREYEEALRLAPDDARIKANFQGFTDNLEPPAKKAEAGTKDADEKK